MTNCRKAHIRGPVLEVAMGARNRNRLRTRCGIESPSTVGFSTVADFPTDCGGPAAVDIHDVH